MINVLSNIDCVPSNVQLSHQEALLYVFEDNEAVIKMIIKGRSPTMRHVSRTHRVALDWLFDRINLDSKIQIKYIDTKNQLADILTKGNFTRDEWNHLLCLFNNSHFSSTNCLEVMSKRTQEDAKIFGNIFCIVLIGLTASGRFAWQEEEETRKKIQDIQDAILLILHYRTM